MQRREEQKAYLVEDNIVGAAKRTASLLQSVTNGVDLFGEKKEGSASRSLHFERQTHAQLPSNLLVNNRANECSRDIPSLFLGEQILIAESKKSLLRLRVGHGDDVGDLVVDEKEDERDGLDRLGEEETEGGEGGGFGGVGGGDLGW